MNPIIRSFREAAVFAAAAALLAACATTAQRPESQLIKDLDSPSENMVCDALQALEKRHPNSPAAREAIVSKLDDSREVVRRKAARVLGVIGAKLDPEQLGKVESLLASTDPNTVIDGLKALRGVGDAATVPAILPLLKHGSPYVRRDACRTLAVLGDRDVAAHIEPLLSDPDHNVQEDARLAIAKLQEK